MVFWLVAALLFTGDAHADESVSSADAAVAADEAASEHCATGWSSEGVTKADALIAVGSALKMVEEVWEREQPPFLLYWRGVLYKCLGQYEDALDDLEAFIEAEKGNPGYADQVQTATMHLERAGRRASGSGAGATASWIRRTDPFEVSVRYGVGGGLRQRVCVDAPTDLSTSRCEGVTSPHQAQAGALWPVHADASVRGFPSSTVGVSGGAVIRYALADEAVDSRDAERDLSIDLGPTEPSVVAGVGAAMRFANWQSEGRAAAFRFEPRFVVAIHSVEPQAGHYNYDNDAAGGQMQAGQWRAVNLGLSLLAEGQIEVSNVTMLAFSGHAEVFAPASGGLLARTLEAEDAVQLPVDAERVDRLDAGGRIGVLFVPKGSSGAVAVGVDFVGDVGLRWLAVPYSPPALWDVSFRVFSTRRLAAFFGVAFRLEVGGVDG